MPVIDAQVHCYERNHLGRPWAAVLPGPPEVTGPDMIKAMDEGCRGRRRRARSVTAALVRSIACRDPSPTTSTGVTVASPRVAH